MQECLAVLSRTSKCACSLAPPIQLQCLARTRTAEVQNWQGSRKPTGKAEFTEASLNKEKHEFSSPLAL